MLVLGVLGAASLIIARRPDAKEMIDKIAPYQGWIGAVSAVWGIWMIISAVLSVGWLALGMGGAILWATYLADGVLQAALGLLLGVGVLKQFIKDPTANEKMDQTIAKLAPYQGTMGLIAIGVGIWMIVANVLFSVA